MLVGFLAVLVKFRAIVPLVPTVMVTVTVWFGETPSEAEVARAEVAVRAVVVLAEVKEKTPVVPEVWEVMVITPGVVFVTTTEVLILVFALIAFIKLVAAVVVVSLVVTRMLVVMLLIVALNIPAVPVEPPRVIVLICAVGVAVVLVEDESCTTMVVVPCVTPVTERVVPSVPICAVAIVESGAVPMLYGVVPPEMVVLVELPIFTETFVGTVKVAVLLVVVLSRV